MQSHHPNLGRCDVVGRTVQCDVFDTQRPGRATQLTFGPNRAERNYDSLDAPCGGLGRHVGTPNSKPHFMVAFRAIVGADVCVVSFLQHVAVRGPHLFPASTFWELGEAGCG